MFMVLTFLDDCKKKGFLGPQFWPQKFQLCKCGTVRQAWNEPLAFCVAFVFCCLHKQVVAQKTFFFGNLQEKSVFFVKGVNTKGLVFPNHQES